MTRIAPAYTAVAEHLEAQHTPPADFEIAVHPWKHHASFVMATSGIFPLSYYEVIAPAETPMDRLRMLLWTASTMGAQG